jgi:hypothetical protein
MFRGDRWFLSNFYPAPVVLDGVIFPTVEHGYQAAKTLHRPSREVVRRAATPGQAKRLGRALILRPDWEAVKLAVMEGLLRQKFADPKLRARLVVIEGEIVEQNTWGDTWWGVCRGRGENHLGRLLMRIRDEA